MKASAFTTFSTPIGTCAISWRDRGIIGVQLPQASDEDLLARLHRIHPGGKKSNPGDNISTVIKRITELLNGIPNDLTEAVLDMEGLPIFDRSAYEILRTVPPGKTITYGEIATRIGDPKAARAVGRAMGANPFPIIVPCHRVLGSDGRMGGFSASGGIVTKARLLSIECARIDDAPLLFEELPFDVRPTAVRQKPPEIITQREPT